MPRSYNSASVSKMKAKKMLREGMAGGKKLTSKQKGFFGMIAGGARPSKKRM